MYLQTQEVQLQLVTVGVGFSQQTTVVSGIKIICRFHIGVVTTTHQFIEDDNLMTEINGGLSRTLHTTDVTTTIEGTEIGRVLIIVIRISVCFRVKHHAGHEFHDDTIHIFIKSGGISQDHGVKLRPVTGNRCTIIGTQHAIVEFLLVTIDFLMCLHHALTIVPEEHVVSIDIRTDFQLHRGLRLRSGKRSTVATYIDGATDDGGLIFRAIQTERHLLGIGTEVVERLYGSFALGHLIVQIAVGRVVLQGGVVGIGIGTVTTAVDVATDTGIDTHGITAIDMSCDIITAIDVVNITTTYQHTCRQS